MLQSDWSIEGFYSRFLHVHVGHMYRNYHIRTYGMCAYYITVKPSGQRSDLYCTQSGLGTIILRLNIRRET